MSTRPLAAALLVLLALAPRPGIAQEADGADCQERGTTEEQRSCWVERALDGEKDLSGADLLDADLSFTVLTDVNLSGANLSLVSLYGADLSGADLTGAVLSEADLSYAILVGADLTGADLTDADLNGARVSRSTTRGLDFDDWPVVVD